MLESTRQVRPEPGGRGLSVPSSHPELGWPLLFTSPSSALNDLRVTENRRVCSARATVHCLFELSSEGVWGHPQEDVSVWSLVQKLCSRFPIPSTPDKTHPPLASGTLGSLLKARCGHQVQNSCETAKCPQFQQWL